jgi:hypothetical protein
MTMMELFSMIFFPCALVVLLVWLNSRERLLRYRMQADLYTKTLEKGHSVTLPDGLFAEPEKRSGSLKTGVICITVGIAIALGFWLVSIIAAPIEGAEDMSAGMRILSVIGILPFMIGVAFLIIHFFEKKRSAGGKAE